MMVERNRKTAMPRAAEIDDQISIRMWRMGVGNPQPNDISEVTVLIRDRANLLVPLFLQPKRGKRAAA